MWLRAQPGILDAKKTPSNGDRRELEGGGGAWERKRRSLEKQIRGEVRERERERERQRERERESEREKALKLELERENFNTQG